MRTDPERYVLAAWKLPLIVAAIICSIVGGFYLGGAGLGLAVGAMAASSVIVWAARKPPRPAIVPPLAADGRVRLLLLVDGAVGAAAVSAAAVTVAASAAADAVEVLALVPLSHGLLARWTSDTDKGRRLAEGRLAMVVSAFERAGVRVSGALGDEEPAQAVEDALRSYPATAVALLATEPSEKADLLNGRLGVPFVRLRTRDHPAPAPREERAPTPTPPGAAAR